MAISVVINTYNAEKFLRRVLDSAKDFDEIVICDMESTDSTLDIAREYGCKIITFPKGECNIVEPARNFAIQSASSDWVLVVDADELVTSELRNYLYHCIRNEDCPKGLFIPRNNLFMGKFSHANFPDFQLRFFIRKGTVWPPYIHRIPVVQGTVEKLPRKKSLALVHLADDSMKTMMKKTDLYSDNEVEKKMNKGYGYGALIYRPIFRFFKSFVLKGGFRDGIEGFVCAGFEAFYQFIIICKIIERKKIK